jgi:hypothetical protein
VRSLSALDTRVHKAVTAFLLLALNACSGAPGLSVEFVPVVSDMAHTLLESGRSGELPREEWPYAIMDVLRPESIRLNEDGVYIVTSGFFVEEAGVFVPRYPQQFTPIARSDPEYNHLALDVYTYRIRS